MADEHAQLWESDAEARLLASRLAGFWNLDYLQQVIVPLLDFKPGARVLDVGAGTGSLTLLLARLLPDTHFVGVDITPKLVEDAQTQAAALGLQNVEFREGDALKLPFADAAFDATVCQTLLIHLGDPAGAVREMSRVLRPGGSFLAAEYHTLNAEWPIDRERLAPTDAEASDAAKYTQMIIRGYRNSGQGDLKVGGQVPFLAVESGLEIVDVRINDRVAHAFPPYRKPTEHAALAEAQSWVELFKDASYRAWLSGALAAGGGAAADVDRFLALLPERQREALARGADAEYAFVWLINPVLLVTIARKR